MVEEQVGQGQVQGGQMLECWTNVGNGKQKEWEIGKLGEDVGLLESEGLVLEVVVDHSTCPQLSDLYKL